MWCNVSQPNSVLLEVQVDPKGDGQECLDKVCEKLGIIETDYFGLQFRGSKGEILWLNLRNRIDSQLPGPAPYRFQLRVKFFVMPHFVLQESTRHQFYLQVKQELQTQKLEVADISQAAEMVALMSQAEYGDQNKNSYQKNLYNLLLHGILKPTEEFLKAVSEKHSNMNDLSRSGAEYKFLQEAAMLQNYGMEYHEAKISCGDPVRIGVGPDGVFICNKRTNSVEKVVYPLIQMATHVDKTVILRVFDEHGEPSIQLCLKLVSRKGANALYRCVTEMHSFYRCDTVRNDVSTQFSRDLKGTLVSIFNENTSLGKSYIFDIKRTCREAYDHARRRLHTAKRERCETSSSGLRLKQNKEKEYKENVQCDSNDNGNCIDECGLLKEKIANIEDSFLCCVCMDSPVSTALCPCGHVICCTGCAEQIQECPMCRAVIDHVQKVYIPALQFQQMYAPGS